MASNKRKANRHNTEILLDAISHLIDNARERATTVVNIELIVLHWQIGKCINDAIRQYKKPGNADAALGVVSERLKEKYGKNWTVAQLKHFSHCATVFSERQILEVLKVPLSWTHIRILSHIGDPLRLKFYLGICIQEKWTAGQLQQSINSRLFEQCSGSKKSSGIIKKELELLNEHEPKVDNPLYSDSSFMDFLGLKETYFEKDLSESVLVEFQKLLMHHDNDFAFLTRRKTILSDDKEYCIGLLFYHRQLSRLLMINVDIDSSSDYHKRMDTSLRWLEKNERHAAEQPPIGLTLYLGKPDEQIDVWTLHEESIQIIPYPPELPSAAILQRHLKEATRLAKQKHVCHTSLASKRGLSAEEIFVGSRVQMFTNSDE